MKQITENCKQQRNSTVISVSEKKAKFIIENPEEKSICQVKIDDCVIINGERCDYFFDVEKQIQYLVELKGHQFKKAISQLENTYSLLKDYNDVEFRELHFCVVLSRVPKIGLDIQKIQKRLSKQKIQLRYASRMIKVRI